MNESLWEQVLSYIKDATHFLYVIKDIEINETDTLCTIDISLLYTNRPHWEGIEAIWKCMRKQ